MVRCRRVEVAVGPPKGGLLPQRLFVAAGWGRAAVRQEEVKTGPLLTCPPRRPVSAHSFRPPLFEQVLQACNK